MIRGGSRGLTLTPFFLLRAARNREPHSPRALAPNLLDCPACSVLARWSSCSYSSSRFWSWDRSGCPSLPALWARDSRSSAAPAMTCVRPWLWTRSRTSCVTVWRAQARFINPLSDQTRKTVRRRRGTKCRRQTRVPRWMRRRPELTGMRTAEQRKTLARPILRLHHRLHHRVTYPPTRVAQPRPQIRIVRRTGCLIAPASFPLMRTRMRITSPTRPRIQSPHATQVPQTRI